MVAEVLFPNTVPPFFEQGNLVALPPSEADYDAPVGRPPGAQPLAGRLLRRRHPDRRAGIIQIFLNHIDDAIAEVRELHAQMNVCGGILLPSVSPNAGLHELWDPYYEPLWELCEELDLPINIHSGSGLPDYGDLEAGAGDHAHRAPVVRAPAAVAPDVRWRVRPSPDACA